MPVNTRSRGRKTTHMPEETEVDGSLSYAHVPMHAHVTSDEVDQNMEGSSVCGEGLGPDRPNVALLTFLYVLQGIPLGLAGSIPYLLSSRNVSYKEQAMFSFVFWPFSVKLLWAPIVDAVYSTSFGRRKSWLVPTQYLIGLFMLGLSLKVTDLLGGVDSSIPVNILTLTVVFFALNFLAATQDIAVDGWALTMLSRKNVGWASTCNTIGQTAGYFLGNVVFMALESADFCNRYLRSEPEKEGLVTLAGFLWFWGIVFLITTTLVMIMKRERDDIGDDDVEQNVVESYKTLYGIMKLPSIQSLIVILLTCKIGFAAADSVTGLKLIEEGVPRERLALLGIPMVPIQIILPLLISKYTAGPRPMDLFVKAMPFRLIMGLVFMWVVWWAPSTKSGDGEYPLYFYGVVLLSYAVHQVALYCMFVSQMAFFAKISDPLVGGTYMTLLNTITNLGGNWPSTVALWFVDYLTWKSCSGADGLCDTPELSQACTEAGGVCETNLDGHYIESVACFIIGVIWVVWRGRRVRSLQDLSPRAWTLFEPYGPSKSRSVSSSSSSAPAVTSRSEPSEASPSAQSVIDLPKKSGNPKAQRTKRTTKRSKKAKAESNDSTKKIKPESAMDILLPMSQGKPSEYHFEKLIGRRSGRRGEGHEYEIVWNTGEVTWEHETNIDDLESIIQEYYPHWA